MTKALTIERREDNVAIIWFDLPNESVNLLRPELLDEFHTVFDTLRDDSSIRGIVLASGKEDNFCVGADVNLLAKLDSVEEISQLTHTVHRLMDQIEDFSIPIVAAIHGTCVGGGLEMALACHGRVASDAEATSFGLPEVKLGIIPGAGGTQRLLATVGLEEALNLILTGNTISADKAASLGIVEETVPKWILIDVAAEHARELAASGQKEDGRSLLSLDRIRSLLLEDNPAGRRILFNQAKEQVLARTQGNMPAPLRAIEVIRTGVEDGPEAGYQAEAEAFGELAMSPEARELIYLFLTRQELKKESGVDDPDIAAREVRKAGVIGAGLMGSGIAYVTAVEAGLPVRLKDINHKEIRGGLKSIHDILARRVSRGKFTEWEKTTYLTRIHPTTGYTGFGRADVVIEAVVEDIDIKHQVLREVEEHTPENAIFASNTSSIPISKLAEASTNPAHVLGMHYFSPVHKLPLLEIIATEQTAPEAVATCVALGKRQGKTVIVVNDGPGFYTTRILGPYLNEAFRMLMQGVSIKSIDNAIESFGFPMGPIRLLDEVGIDIAHKIMAIMHDAFGERMQSPTSIERLIEDERYGEKNGRGFYKYNGENGEEVDESVYNVLGITPDKTLLDEQTIQERCVLQMVNEAAYCYGEGILRSARDGNIGAVFGLGFPPFLGGPFRYIDARGAGHIVQRLEHYQAQHGERFAPAPALKTMNEQDAIPEPGTFPAEKEIS